MTLDKLAQMVQGGFAETATKHELQVFRQEVSERFDKLELHLSASVISLREDIEYLHSYVKDLERRLRRVEARR